jgi:hypothetical protein
MKSKFPFLAAVALAAVLSGCATRSDSTGGKETTLLAGAMTVATDSFQPTNAATVDADTSKIIGRSGPSGTKVTLLWGLITLHDY